MGSKPVTNRARCCRLKNTGRRISIGFSMYVAHKVKAIHELLLPLYITPSVSMADASIVEETCVFIA